MNLIYWALFGLLAGAIAKYIMPGKEASGWIMTLVLGIVGSIVGGFLGTLLGLGDVNTINIGSLILAVVGAMIVIWISRQIAGRR